MNSTTSASDQGRPAASCVSSPQAGAADFESFYQATLHPLRRYLSRILGSRHDAQDIAHDAYLKTYRSIADRTVHQPKAYLFKSAFNLAVSYRKRRSDRMVPSEDTIIEANAPLVEDAVRLVMERQDEEALDAALKSLPTRCRQVLGLRTNEGLSQAEIAQRLGISESAVEKHVCKALTLLRQRMSRTR